MKKIIFTTVVIIFFGLCQKSWATVYCSNGLIRCFNDARECLVARGFNPDPNWRKPFCDSDCDGLTDNAEDMNGNCLCDPGETCWLNSDTDNDGLPDGVEVLNLHTNPLNADTDGDGISDGVEVHFHPFYTSGIDTDPTNPDTDGDGIMDGIDPCPLDPNPNCVPPPPVVCVDTDGGDTPNAAGSARYEQGGNIIPDGEQKDICWPARARAGGQKDLLIESYCDAGGQIASHWYACKPGFCAEDGQQRGACTETAVDYHFNEQHPEPGH